MHLILNLRRIFVQKIKYASGIAGKLLPFHVFGNASLLTMSISAGIVISVTFQQVDDTPDAETSAQSDNESLQNGDCLIKKCHKL